jgi:hypothetical protein
MIGHYPDEPTLQTIIVKRYTLAIGDQLKETIVPLVGQGIFNKQLQAEEARQAIKD